MVYLLVTPEILIGEAEKKVNKSTNKILRFIKRIKRLEMHNKQSEEKKVIHSS